jgi:hypothetical protein
MPRERASFNLDMQGDADWRDLTDPAQSLYYKLMNSKLNYCGVGDFHPGRLAARTREQTADQVVIAAQELSDKFWIVIDQSTDEVMVRGYLRHDGVLKQPKLAVSAALAYASVASNKIRAVIVFEIQRFRRENPDLGAWEKPQMKTLLKQPATPATDTLTDLSWSFTTTQGHGYGHALPLGSTTATTAPSTGTSTSTSTGTTSKEVSEVIGSSYPHQAPEARKSRELNSGRLEVAS